MIFPDCFTTNEIELIKKGRRPNAGHFTEEELRIAWKSVAINNVFANIKKAIEDSGVSTRDVPLICYGNLIRRIAKLEPLPINYDVGGAKGWKAKAEKILYARGLIKEAIRACGAVIVDTTMFQIWGRIVRKIGKQNRLKKCGNRWRLLDNTGINSTIIDMLHASNGDVYLLCSDKIYLADSGFNSSRQLRLFNSVQKPIATDGFGSIAETSQGRILLKEYRENNTALGFLWVKEADENFFTQTNHCGANAKYAGNVYYGGAFEITGVPHSDYLFLSDKDALMFTPWVSAYKIKNNVIDYKGAWTTAPESNAGWYPRRGVFIDNYDGDSVLMAGSTSDNKGYIRRINMGKSGENNWLLERNFYCNYRSPRLWQDMLGHVWAMFAENQYIRDAKIARTEDFGQTWQEKDVSLFFASCTPVAIDSDTHLFGIQNQLAITRDNFETTETITGINGNLTSVCMLSDGRLLVATDAQKLYISEE